MIPLSECNLSFLKNSQFKFIEIEQENLSDYF